jgi:hypothetical protein
MNGFQRQVEFAFDIEGAGDGLMAWRWQREQELGALARRAGLPIGHLAEIWLKGGVRLRGLLRLHEERLFVDDEKVNELVLEVEGVRFQMSELESCVRTD